MEDFSTPSAYIEVPQNSFKICFKHCSFQELQLTTSKKHHPDKLIWETWRDQFARHGINNFRLRNKFRQDFTLDYTIVLDLFQDDEFLAHIKKNRILSKENTFLAFLHKVKTGICFFIYCSGKRYCFLTR